MKWAWIELGRFISGHLLILVPICLVIAILAPEPFAPLRPIVPTLFALMTFQSSLGNRLDNFKQALAHPLPIVLVIVFAHVVAPVAGFLFGQLFFGDRPEIVAGIVLEYCVPTATSAIMWVSLYRGSTAVSLAILLISTFIAPFTIPATMQLLLGAAVEINALGMFTDMLYMTVIPAAAAFAFNELSNGWASKRVSPVLAPAARIAMLLIITVNTTAISGYIRHMTPELGEITLFIGVFATCSYLAGIGLAKATRRSREEFTPVAFGCGMRNISAGAVLAAQYFPAATTFPVIVGTLFQQFLAACFGKLMKRILAQRDDGAPSAQM